MNRRELLQIAVAASVTSLVPKSKAEKVSAEVLDDLGKPFGRLYSGVYERDRSIRGHYDVYVFHGGGNYRNDRFLGSLHIDESADIYPFNFSLGLHEMVPGGKLYLVDENHNEIKAVCIHHSDFWYKATSAGDDDAGNIVSQVFGPPISQYL